MRDNHYERIVSGVTRRRGARLVVAVVPRGTSVHLSIEKLVPQLEGRGVRLHHVRMDADGDLPELVENAAKGVDESDVLMVHGFESVPQADAEAFFRRSNFTRGRLGKLARAVLLVVEAQTWSWLVMELPDLVRWADGPFLLPAIERPPHPLVGISESRVHLGRPIPDALCQPLDRERGVDAYCTALEGLKHGRLVVLGGPPGVGRSHLAVRLEHEVRGLGRSTAWPQSLSMVNGRVMVAGRSKTIDPGQTFECWLREQSADIVIIPQLLADDVTSMWETLTKLRKCGVVLSTTASGLAQGSSIVQPVYLPPVRVELSENEPHEPGIELLVEATRARARLFGTDLASALSDQALRFLVFASGGVPAILWKLTMETSRRAGLEGVLPAPLKLARIVAIDMGRSWAEASTPDMRRRSLRRREENEGLRQLLIVDKRLVRLRHPLLRLAEEGGV